MKAPDEKGATLAGRPEETRDTGTLPVQPQAVKSGGESISRQVRKSLDRYKVSLMPVREIRPSPENDEIYGTIDFANDPALSGLVKSIQRLGLEEPIILTRDNFILSGHRRFVAVKELGWKHVPVRFASVSRGDTGDYYRLLAEYNPQRIKSAATSLVESLLMDEATESTDSFIKFTERREALPDTFAIVDGEKPLPEIGPRRMQFLEAAVRVINELKAYWPLTIRQIHYGLLNDPPLTQTTEIPNERWRYKNDLGSYQKLSDLLSDARYDDAVPWEAINDDTRRSTEWNTFSSAGEFIEEQAKNFLRGYALNRQADQPHHIECILEKNTLLNVCMDTCRKLHVTMTALRGYGGPSVWKSIEDRFHYTHDRAGKSRDAKLILIFVSDHDPEGFNLMDDCARSLRDRHDLPVEIFRAGVTMEQANGVGAKPNPAKKDSTRFQEYVNRTGTTDTWECESLPPAMLEKALHDAILEHMDVDTLNATMDREHVERKQLATLREDFGEFLKMKKIASGNRGGSR